MPTLSATEARTRLTAKAELIFQILRENPYQVPPACEKLVGDLARAYSRRINIQHRLLHQVFTDEKVVKVIRKRTHYE
jgi:toxin YoeB